MLLNYVYKQNKYVRHTHVKLIYDLYTLKYLNQVK